MARIFKCSADPERDLLVYSPLPGASDTQNYRLAITRKFSGNNQSTLSVHLSREDTLTLAKTILKDLCLTSAEHEDTIGALVPTAHENTAQGRKIEQLEAKIRTLIKRNHRLVEALREIKPKEVKPIATNADAW